MVQFDYISDIHTDFHCKTYSTTHRNFHADIDAFAESILPSNPSNTLIVAGDLGHRFEQDSYLLTSLKKVYKDIILVHGNHCLYLVSSSIRKRYNNNSFLRIKEMKDFCDGTEGLHYLDGDSIELDSVTYAGCGMSWDKTHFEKLIGEKVEDSEVLFYYQRYLNDYKLISCGREPITVRSPYQGTETVGDFDPFRFFKDQYKKLSSIEKADIVVSHYAPCFYESMPLHYQKELGTSFYYFDGTEILEKLKPTAWVFGHTHTKINDKYKTTDLICNPFGYPNENPGAIIQTYKKEV